MVHDLYDPLLPQLALFALSSSLSPGQNNLLIAASAAWFGMRRSLPTLAGMYAGFMLMFLAVGLGASVVFAAVPGLLRTLQFLGAGYLLVLAAGLLKATWAVKASASPLGPVRAAALQFLNPKLWLMAMSTVALCTRTGPDGGAVSIPLVAFFVAMTVPSMLLYLKFGAVLRVLASSRRTRTWTNRALAALTALSALLLLTPMEMPPRQPSGTDAAEKSHTLVTAPRGINSP